MASILSFNYNVTTYLLSDEHSEVFEERQQSVNYRPVFYMNKIQKCHKKYAHYFYRAAPDVAYKSMQREAVESIIEFIVKY